jgi:hypothetical protein
MKTKITVAGLGGGINFEMKIIEKALRDAGCKVEVVNSAADWICSQGNAYVPRIVLHNFENPNTATEVELIADHIPWGG